MKPDAIAALAIAVLFPFGVLLFVFSPAAVRWTIEALMAMNPGWLVLLGPVGVGLGLFAALHTARRRTREEQDTPRGML